MKLEIRTDFTLMITISFLKWAKEETPNFRSWQFLILFWIEPFKKECEYLL
jgi:hypothetical protein